IDWFGRDLHGCSQRGWQSRSGRRRGRSPRHRTDNCRGVAAGGSRLCLGRDRRTCRGRERGRLNFTNRARSMQMARSSTRWAVTLSLLRGALLLIGGLVAMAMPDYALRLVVIVGGAILLVDGLLGALAGQH